MDYHQVSDLLQVQDISTQYPVMGASRPIGFSYAKAQIALNFVVIDIRMSVFLM